MSTLSMFRNEPPFWLVQEGYVAPHPVTARNNIAERYSCELTLSGRECEGITSLRRSVERLDRQCKFARCLFITAPHTHWGEKQIIESFDPDREIYLSGPLCSHSDLNPISFVFSSKGAIPYEWAEENVSLDAADLNEVYAFIARLNDEVNSRLGSQLPIPLGVMIDHRFKQSIWDEQLFSFIEGPSNEEDGRAVIRPLIESVVRPQARYSDQVQVAWSAFPDSEFSELRLNESESKALLQLEAMLDEKQPVSAITFMSEVEEYLRSKGQNAG